MILTLLRRAVKALLHEAVDEWAAETGLPQKVVQEMRAQRLAIAAQAEARADSLAAASLGVEDEEVQTAPVLLMSSAAQTTIPLRCPNPSTDDAALLGWIHQQRQQETPWAVITQTASENGHTISEEALRTRYRRWRDKNGQEANPSDPSA